MASTYTSNQGLEKPATGDRSGTWGTMTNTNMDILDRAISGVGALSLTGTTTTLTTSEGSASDGNYKVLVLGGSPSGTNTITLSPNDADKLYFVVNASGQSVIFSQGTGANVTVANGAADIIYADGAGSGAAVSSYLANDFVFKTGDGAILNLQTSDTTVTASSVLGRLNFSAPDEASGTDAILLAASIAAISEGTFAADDNATKLSFMTGASEAAAEKMSLSSGGNLSLPTDSAVIKLGADQDVTITHVADTGLNIKQVTDADDKALVLKLQTGETDIVVNDYIARLQFQAPDEAGGTDAITVCAEISALSEGTFAADSNATSLLFGTGASGAATAKMKLSSGGNLSLPTDGVVIAAGVNSDVTLTHVHDTGLLLNSTMALQFNDASQYINAPSATVLDINATDEVEINATLADVNANLDVSGTYTGGGLMTTGGNIVIPDDGTIGSASDTDAIQIRSDGNVGIGASASDTIGLYVYNNTTGDKVGQFTQAHASNSNNALQVTQAGTGAGLYAQVELGTNAAVYGFHNSSSSAGIGTRGYSKSGYGVYGQTGAAAYAGIIGYSQDASEYAILGYNNTYGVYATTVTCAGAMSKGSGTFRIPHGLRENYDLCHSFVEGPQCDLIYRGRVDLVNGRATVSMDTRYGMTAGTFAWLTRDVQTFTSNETGWDAVKSSFSGDTITIECQNTSSTDTISWMVVAERDDPNIKSSSITDSNGDLLIERPSDPLPPPPLEE